MPEMLAFHNLLDCKFECLLEFVVKILYLRFSERGFSCFLLDMVCLQPRLYVETGARVKGSGTALRLSACLFVRLLLPTDSAYASRRTPSAVVK